MNSKMYDAMKKSKSSFFEKKWKKLNTEQLKKTKGKGWGNDTKLEWDNCPPPYEPGGKKDDKE